MTITSYKRRVNYYETDKMKIVHHTNYVRYFEEARIDFMRQINCSCSELESEGILIPVVDAYARFHKSLKFDDEFYVQVKLDKFNGARMEFSYEIRFFKDDSLAVTGHTSHCFINENMKPLSVKRKFPEVYKRMMEFTAEK